MLNTNTTHVKILNIHVYYTNRNMIMNFVGNDGESEPWKNFWIFCVRVNSGGCNEWFISLFIWLLCLLLGRR